MKRYLYNLVIRKYSINAYFDQVSSIVSFLNSPATSEFRAFYQVGKDISTDQVENMIRRPNKNPKRWENEIMICRTKVKHANTHAKVEEYDWSDEDSEIEELEQYLRATQIEAGELEKEIWEKKKSLMIKKGVKATDCILKESKHNPEFIIAKQGLSVCLL
tara:strand:+ start:1116 stop:1598 length:483 start_codon:yes stop_codon:yes gene_type:complete